MPTGAASAARVLKLACAAGLTVAAAAVLWHGYRTRCVKAARKRRSGAGDPLEAPTLSLEVVEALAREAAAFGSAADEELQEEFANAAAWVSDAGAGLPTMAKLAMYGCYKQAVAGDAPEECPRGMEAGAKWDAWNQHRGARCSEAMRRYVAALGAMAPQWRLGMKFEASAGAGESRGLGVTVSTMGRINAGDSGGEDDVDATPVGKLCEMIAEGDVDAVQKELRRQPALAFEKDKDGMTPLHWAADRGSIAIAKLLVSLSGNGAAAASRLNLQDEAGDTALHYAVMSEHQELAKLLVASGADPHAKNEEGETPSRLAEELEGWEEVFHAA